MSATSDDRPPGTQEASAGDIVRVDFRDAAAVYDSLPDPAARRDFGLSVAAALVADGRCPESTAAVIVTVAAMDRDDPRQQAILAAASGNDVFSDNLRTFARRHLRSPEHGGGGRRPGR